MRLKTMFYMLMLVSISVGIFAGCKKSAPQAQASKPFELTAEMKQAIIDEYAKPPCDKEYLGELKEVVYEPGDDKIYLHYANKLPVFKFEDKVRLTDPNDFYANAVYVVIKRSGPGGKEFCWGTPSDKIPKESHAFVEDVYTYTIRNLSTNEETERWEGLKAN
jgi:hypothetical protein